MKSYPKVEIRDAKHIHPALGFGLFAKKNIKKGEILFLIKGEVVNLVVEDSDTASLYPNAVGFGKDQWIDPYPTNPLVYLNHSCQPNAGIRGTVTVCAMKPIKKGDHITIDYSTTEIDPFWRLEKRCGCKSEKCRKIIKSVQSLDLQIFNSYLPFVPRFVQNVYLAKFVK